jgi:HAD superfamily hydrolase (TIGR01509 family)
MGGVVCADTWESLFLAPGIGLAFRHGLDPVRVAEIGGDLWHRYAYAAHAEEAYWDEWDAALGIRLDRAAIRRLYGEAIWVDETAATVVARCLDSGVRVAIVSNSTSFWLPMQLRLSGLDRLADRLKLYASHEIGHAKTHPQGGLALLARDEDPRTVLFVDDRIDNIRAARNLGMDAVQYRKERDRTLADFIGSCLMVQDRPGESCP